MTFGDWPSFIGISAYLISVIQSWLPLKLSIQLCPATSNRILTPKLSSDVSNLACFACKAVTEEIQAASNASFVVEPVRRILHSLCQELPLPPFFIDQCHATLEQVWRFTYIHYRVYGFL